MSQCNRTTCKNIPCYLEEGIFSIYGGKFNVKLKDDSLLYDERQDIEEGLDEFKSGQTILYCPICFELEE
tara:strand:- start:888 stop:1097 length:210 start_codon:yes stop_codon:yes gene_type:complete